ncbi:MAG: hypothetical protein LBG84_11595 [Treponema sp.]|nr:hypothetical protein [Treponema sp.]
MNWNRFLNRSFLLCLVAPFFSCGVEDYVYLNPVETAYSVGVTRATITLPSGQPSEFRYYTIFYRIYISDILSNSITSDAERRNINPSLATHYNTLDPYTANDSNPPNNLVSIFNSLRYYSLYVSQDKITEIPLYDQLNSASGGAVYLDFTDTSDAPFMTINNPNGTRFYLFRAPGFTSLPDRLFYNTSGPGSLSEPITSDTNADVEQKSGVTPSPQYTYVSLYIAATGTDNNFAPLYSRPKHIGILRLFDLP